MTQTIWQGTVDNLELSGQPNGNKQPMRLVEDADGQLITEFAFSSLNDEGEIQFDEGRWIADYQMRFRDMQPAISEAIRSRMIASNLVEA